MRIAYYHVDTFTNKIFAGNPAAVCVLQKELPENILQAIAKENNLPVTAFLFYNDKKFQIRWLTPEYELDLCGHGTLAASYVIFNFLEPQLTMVTLHSRNESLQVTRKKNLITLNFPAKKAKPCTLPLLAEGLGVTPVATFEYQNERCFVVLANEEEVKKLIPQIEILKKLPHRGVTVTALGKEIDFVSRTFYPQKNYFEDPATGASHCLLVPYWHEQLHKTEFHARQLSERGGELFCRYEGDRVLISGNATLYLKGEIELLSEEL